eukprot:Skav216600  [mRNA]  locus=scaffold2855:201999:204292:+ [translate_table: standard]
MHPSTPDAVEELTVSLAGLQITISVRPQPGSGGTTNGPTTSVSSAVVGPPESTTTGLVLSPDPVTLALVEQALATGGSRNLASLPLPFLDYLVPRLRSTNAEWPARARLGRAFRAGVEARIRLEGQFCNNSSEGIPFRTFYYICLRAPGYPEGFWTSDYNQSLPGWGWSAMAASTAVRPFLDAGALEELAAGITASKALPGLLLGLDPGESGQARYAVTYLVRVRLNGFMVASVATPEVQEALLAAGMETDEVVTHFEDVVVVSTRGKQLGQSSMMLADLTWSSAGSFSLLSSLRGTALRSAELVSFEVDSHKGRPQTTHVLEIADRWISEAMDEDTALEYATGVEDLGGPPGVEEEPVPETDPQPEMDEKTALQQKIYQLEAQLLAAQTTAAQQPRKVEAPRVTFGKTPALFRPDDGVPLDAKEMEKLRSMAGAAPPRTGKNETHRPVQDLVPHQDGFLAELEKEVVEVGGETQFDVANPANLTQMLMIQMQQNSMLLQRLVGNRPTDPVMGALSDSGSGSGNNSGNVKGCVAREAYCKATSDLGNISAAVLKNALAELGMEPSRADSSVMRRYIERRIPLADHRLLCHFATLASEGWALAYASSNTQMQGFLGLMLMFIEQVALDQGKLQLAWLLTGLSEPNHQVHFRHRNTPGLKPFSRLANPIWISANLAYLRDLDYLEGRMEQLGKKKNGTPSADPDSDQPSKPQPKKKNQRPKCKGKGGETDAKAQTADS